MGEVTPWEVKGEVDYDRLLREFGIESLPKLPKAFADHLLFRRGFIFAHRDLARIVDAVQHKKHFVMMTGLMPTGKFHFGHLLVARQMLLYQSLGAKLYICVADLEAYATRNQTIEESRKNAIEEYLLNYAALGIDLKKAEVYFQSDRSKDGVKAGAYYRLQNILARHATFNEISPAKMVAALLQASDMLHPQLQEFEGKMPVVVPVGVDQDPHIRLARDIAKRVPGYDFIPLSSSYHVFLPGLGGGKMSSSDPLSFVALTEDPKEVKRKINKYAFSGGQATVDEHRAHGGNPAVDVSFQYLRFFEEDDDRLAEVEKDYRSGKLLTGELKGIVIEKLTAFLEQHQARREKMRASVAKMLS
jgi:tryptophanyl-tRNA synthetase